jgi:hypothetical protein
LEPKNINPVNTAKPNFKTILKEKPTSNEEELFVSCLEKFGVLNARENT